MIHLIIQRQCQDVIKNLLLLFEAAAVQRPGLSAVTEGWCAYQSRPGPLDQQHPQVQRPPYKSQLPRDKDTRRTELSSRTTRAEWDNCLSWLSDARCTKKIPSDLYFAPLLHPKSQTAVGSTSVLRIWMLDLLPWQQYVCFLGFFFKPIFEANFASD